MPIEPMGPPAPTPEQAGPPTQEQLYVDQGNASLTVTRNLTEIPFKLGGLVFPVPPRSMQVRQSAKVDEVKIPKKSGSIRQPTGYEPSEITVDLELVPEENLDGTLVTAPIDRLRALQKLFRDDRAALPKPVDIISPLTDLFGIRQVLIMEITADEDGEADWIPVRLVMTEFESIKTQLENQAAAAVAVNAETMKGKEYIEGNSALEKNLGYLDQRYNAGESAAMGSGEAPGDDTDTDTGEDTF